MSINYTKFVFAADAPYVALIQPDGRVAIWNINTGLQLTTLTPSAHLNSGFISASWMPSLLSHKRKRKRKTSVSNSNGDIEEDSLSISLVLLLGTQTGSLVLYDVNTASSMFDSCGEDVSIVAHSKAVTGLDWGKESMSAFSCSADNTINRITWSTKERWLKSGRCQQIVVSSSGFYSLCVVNDEQSVLAGGDSRIDWWDIETGALLSSFLGHSDHVTQLSLSNSKQYFLSASCTDSVVYLWKIAAPNSSENISISKPMAKMAVNDTIQSLAVLNSDPTENVVAGVITKNGTLLFFEYLLHDEVVLEGETSSRKKKKKKVLLPSKTFQISSAKDSNGKVGMLPVMGIYWTSVCTFVVSYGIYTKPCFEEVDYGSLLKATCLVRQIESVQLTHHVPGSVVYVPELNGASVLAPGPSMPNASVRLSTNKNRLSSENLLATKRKSSAGKVESLPMEERLRLLSRDPNHQNVTPPRADSLLQLLLQGLHNRDKKIIDSVLDRASEDLVENTVKRLPINAVILLIEELQKYIKGRGMVNQIHAKWLRSTLQYHTAYLMSTPKSLELLRPLYAMLESRTKNYCPLLLVKGKLDILTRQISASSGSEASEDNLINKKAELVYQDGDSCDELSDVLDEMLLPGTDVDEFDGSVSDGCDELNGDDASSDSDIELVMNGHETDDKMEDEDSG